MEFPFDKKIKIYIYLLLWLVYALLHAFAVSFAVTTLPFWVSLVYSLIHATLFGFIGIFLGNIVRFGNYETLPFVSRLFNYVSLAVLITVIWALVGYAVGYLVLGEEMMAMFKPVTALNALTGILLYAVFILYFTMTRHQEDEKDNDFPLLPMENELPSEKSMEILERIAVKVGQKIHVVMLPDIDYLQSDGDYVHIHTAQGRFLKEQTMKYFEEHLPSSQFVRAHRSCIVNIEKIARIELYEKQTHLITLKNGQRLKVSTAGYKALRVALGL